MNKDRTPRLLDAMLKGMGGGLFSSSPYPVVHLQARSDRDALHGDWLKIGQDFRGAITRIESEEATNQSR